MNAPWADPFDSGALATDTPGLFQRSDFQPTMLQQLPFPIRTECPPGACTCDRERLLEDPAADLRPLKLTRDEEKRLLARIEAIGSYDELRRLTGKLQELAGVDLQITPSVHGVRTVRGLTIRLAERPGLCRKLRQSIPAAVRRCLDRKPAIIYAMLDAHGLLAAPDLATSDSGGDSAAPDLLS
jgi:hypothetical protein